MIQTPLSRCQFILVAMQLIAASQLPACRASHPVFGKNPIKIPLMVEDHSQLLAHWAEKGVRDAVLINIDTHDDMRWMLKGKLTNCGRSTTVATGSASGLRTA